MSAEPEGGVRESDGEEQREAPQAEPHDAPALDGGTLGKDHHAHAEQQ